MRQHLSSKKKKVEHPRSCLWAECCRVRKGFQLETSTCFMFDSFFPECGADLTMNSVGMRERKRRVEERGERREDRREGRVKNSKWQTRLDSL